MKTFERDQNIKNDSDTWNRARSVTATDSNLAFRKFSHRLDRCIALKPATVAVSQKDMTTTVEALVRAARQDNGDLVLEQIITQLGIDHKYFHAVTYNSLRRPLFEIQYSPPLIMFKSLAST